jgi:hypothetical protein
MSHYIWAQQHMVDRHYSLEFKTMVSHAHADLAQKHSVGLQEIFVSRKKILFPALRNFTVQL